MTLTPEQEARLDVIIARRDATARRLPQRPRALGAPRVPARLSGREMQVLELLAEGDSNPEIAVALGLSEETIKTHVKHCIAKLGARNRTHAAVLALRRGLID